MLSAGYSQVAANPPLGIGMGGYFKPRFAKGFLDDITVSALAISCKEQKMALISVDACEVGEKLVADCREAICKATGLPIHKIMIGATHTHTGPLNAPTDAFEADEAVIFAYAQFLKEKIVEATILALADLRPAKMGYAVGQAPERIAYIRRYKMKDGSTWTCPPINDPNIVCPIGQLDQRVNVVRFTRENAPDVVILNYGIHADTTNGEMLSADFPAWLRYTVEKTLDGVKCMFFPGAQGDVGSTNVHPTKSDMNDTEISFDNEMKSPGMARFVGRALAGVVLQVYDKVNYVDVDSIDMVNHIVKIPANVPNPEDMPLAKKYKQLHDAGRDCDIPYTAMELTTVVAEAIRMCNLENGPDYFPLELTGVKIGPVCMVGIPGEPFTHIGVKIKEAEGWDMIMPCALTNGSSGYFPSEDAFAEGGYEARSSNFKAGISQVIIDGAKEMLQKL